MPPPGHVKRQSLQFTVKLPVQERPVVFQRMPDRFFQRQVQVGSCYSFAWMRAGELVVRTENPAAGCRVTGCIAGVAPPRFAKGSVEAAIAAATLGCAG